MAILPPDEQPLTFARLMTVSPHEVSQEIANRSRMNSANFLHALDATTAAAIGLDLGVHESTISRFKLGGSLTFCMEVLAAVGLKVVPADARVFIEPEEFK